MSDIEQSPVYSPSSPNWRYVFPIRMSAKASSSYMIVNLTSFSVLPVHNTKALLLLPSIHQHHHHSESNSASCSTCSYLTNMTQLANQPSILSDVDISNPFHFRTTLTVFRSPRWNWESVLPSNVSTTSKKDSASGFHGVFGSVH